MQPPAAGWRQVMDYKGEEYRRPPLINDVPGKSAAHTWRNRQPQAGGRLMDICAAPEAACRWGELWTCRALPGTWQGPPAGRPRSAGWLEGSSAEVPDVLVRYTHSRQPQAGGRSWLAGVLLEAAGMGPAVRTW